MKVKEIEKIIEKLKTRGEATILYSDGSKIIIKEHYLYGVNVYVEDRYKSFIRTIKNLKELKNYLKYINIY